jgi:hypothetical protein
MSDDLVHFKKVQKDPYIETPEGYGKVARDAIVFTDEEGGFHLYSTTFLPEGDKEIGCLLHMVSDDMIDWREGEPVVTGGVQPECPDHFYWNGWYYLLYNEVGMTQYRMSRNATGPWIDPGYSPFEGSDAIVMKTAAFGEGRRIGVTWASIPKLGWGGKVVFREVIQHEDGRLGVKFVDEMIPQMKEKLEISFRPIIGNAEFDGKRMHLQALGKKSGAAIHSGGNCRMRLKVIPSGENCEFGIGFGVAEGDTESNIVCFSAKEKTVKIEAGLFMLREVDGLDKPFELDIVVCDDIIDMCIDKRRTYLRMIDGLEFDELRLFCWRGEVGFESIEINEISGKRV